MTGLAQVFSLSLRARTAPHVRRFEAAVVLVYFAWLAVVLFKFAAIRPLWYDELFTLHLARVGSIGDLLGHLAAGVDLNPPLLYLLTRISILTFGETEWAVRLPSLIGMLFGCVCFYAFLRRHGSVAFALFAVAACISSVKVWQFFIEARPYGLVFGFAGLALLSWQRCDPNRRWLIGLGLAAVLGVSSHYYFVCVLAALGYAEVIRMIANKKLDYGPMLMLALGGLTLLAWRPLWSVAPRDYAGGFWAKTAFDPQTLQLTLAHFFEPTMLFAVLASLALAVLFLQARRAGEGPEFPLHDRMALIALALTPILGVLLGATVTGGFYYRYTLPAAFGIGGLFALVIDRTTGRNVFATGLAFLAFVLFGLPGNGKPFRDFFRQEGYTNTELLTVLDLLVTDGVVVIETGAEFGRVWQYKGSRRFDPVFLADVDLAKKYTQVDTTERALLLLKRVTPVPVLSPDELMRRLAAGESVYYYGPATAWGYNDLVARGVRFEKIADRPGGTLFRINYR